MCDAASSASTVPRRCATLQLVEPVLHVDDAAAELALVGLELDHEETLPIERDVVAATTCAPEIGSLEQHFGPADRERAPSRRHRRDRQITASVEKEDLGAIPRPERL